MAKPLKKVSGEGGDGEDEDDEEGEEKPEDINEKKLKKEKAAAFKILESITGKPVIARNNQDESSSKSQT